MNFLIWFLLIPFIFWVVLMIINPEKQILNPDTRARFGGSYIQNSMGITHYEEKGDKNAPNVVLVHGFSTPSYIWDPTFYALCKAGFNVIRFDLFGRGFSDRPKAEYTVEFCVTQLRQLIDDLNISRPVNLVGLSYGGPIVARYVNIHRDSVRSLVLVDPLVNSKIFETNRALNLPIIGELLMAFLYEPFVLPKSQAQDFNNPENFPDWEKRYRIQMQYKGFRRAILSTFRNINQPILEEHYSQIGKTQLPVLGFWGEHDRTISETDIQLLQVLIPQMDLHVIKNAGHIPHFELPESVNPILIEFLEKNNLKN